MEEPLYVRPSQPGLIIRYPEDPGRTLPAEGAVVPSTSYWRRRLHDGSVVVAKRPKEEAK